MFHVVNVAATHGQMLTRSSVLYSELAGHSLMGSTEECSLCSPLSEEFSHLPIIHHDTLMHVCICDLNKDKSLFNDFNNTRIFYSFV